MKKLFYLLQFVAPLIGLYGVALVLFYSRLVHLDLSLALSGVPFILLGLMLRPRPGHPMAKWLGMQRKPRDTPKAPETKAVLRDVANKHTEVPGHYPGAKPHYTAPVKLVPDPPGAAMSGKSWIGGAPALPNSTPWPEMNGTPMLFLAQIALDELPATLWGGMGPRHGWLVFFMPDEGRINKDMLVLHVDEPVIERSWPPIRHGFHFGYEAGKAHEILELAGLPVSQRPSRFSVFIEPLEGQPTVVRPRAKGADVPQRGAIQTDFRLDDPSFQPFDRPTSRALVAALATYQHSRLDQSSFSRPSDGERVSREAALVRLEACGEALLADGADAPMSSQDLNTLMHDLRGITVQQDIGQGKAATLGPAVSILDDERAIHMYRLPHEMLVQRAMREAPERVPEAVRARYTTLWRSDQATDYVVVGGGVHEGFDYSSMKEEAVFLLELPSSNMIGWMMGDGSRLGVCIAPEDLATGRFDKAWGDILN